MYELFGKHLRPEEAPAELAFLQRVLGYKDSETTIRRDDNETARRQTSSEKRKS
jgi:hypothetical protein